MSQNLRFSKRKLVIYFENLRTLVRSTQNGTWWYVLKILKKDLKHGIVKIKIDNPDDAWGLQSILEKGDLISGKTMRSSEVLRGEQKEKTRKKPAFLKIRLEKKEFHEYTGKLRLTGKIVGSEELTGSYHTLEAKPGKVLTIEKDWKKWQLKKIKRRLKKQPRVIVCVMDEREATIAEVGEKVKILAEISNKKAGKQYGGYESKEYFGEIKSFLKRKKINNIILGGPGFAKNNLAKEFDTEKRVILESSSHTGVTGVSEVIKRGAIERVIRESRISKETREVEKFFKKLGKDGLVTYGKEEVERALKAGAVEKLLVSEKMTRDFKELIKLGEKMDSDVVIVSERHQSGEKLKNMGGIAAFLRFKI